MADFKDIATWIVDKAPMALSLAAPLTGPAGPLAGLAIKTIAGWFGIKSSDPQPDEIMKAMQADPEAASKLAMARLDFEKRQMELLHDEKMKELDDRDKTRQAELDEFKTQMAGITGAQGVEIAESKSEDEYVRRTRPGILRRMFWLVAVFCFVAPGMVFLAAKGGMQDFQVDNLISMFTYIGGFLFSTFSIGYTGYAWSRMKEKLAETTGNGNSPQGLLKTFVGIGKK